MGLPFDLAGLAAHVQPDVGAILACAVDAPFLKGSWARAVICALANEARPISRRARFGGYNVHEKDAERFVDAHRRVAHAILAHEIDRRPLGETTVGKLARLLARTLLVDADDERDVLSSALGLDGGHVHVETYAPLAQLATSPVIFAGYLVGYFGGNVDGDDLALIIHPAKQRRRLFPRLSVDEMSERLDRWLTKSAPSADRHRAAVKALVALGMSSEDATALVALAPKRRNRNWAPPRNFRHHPHPGRRRPSRQNHSGSVPSCADPQNKGARFSRRAGGTCRRGSSH